MSDLFISTHTLMIYVIWVKAFALNESNRDKFFCLFSIAYIQFNKNPSPFFLSSATVYCLFASLFIHIGDNNLCFFFYEQERSLFTNTTSRSSRWFISFYCLINYLIYFFPINHFINKNRNMLGIN